MSFSQLVWFRQDLRIHDHTALWHACQQGNTAGIIFLSPQQWQQHLDAPIKIDFYLRQLKNLQQQLNQLNIPLFVRVVSLWRDIPDVLAEFVEQHSIQTVHAHIEVGINEQLRDQSITQKLDTISCETVFYHDRTLFPLGSIRNQQQKPYQVFGAFKRQAYERLSISLATCYPAPQAQTLSDVNQDEIPSYSKLYNENPPESSQVWDVGEEVAFQRLDDFLEHELRDYPQARDFPALHATSQISAYLNIGILSIRQCVQALFRPYFGHFVIEHASIATWLDELLWREFYQHICFDFPHVSKHLPFKLKAQHIPWRNAPEDLHAWQHGQTGIPIVDAGMRQLLATGWMHNRVRMIVAMFLTKNLLIDWRLGEAWFMQHLIDGDLAANNGGWQWCASTGTDSVPYFRIFNPVSQSQKFDADGSYIRHWVPELTHLDAKRIHDPHAKGLDPDLNYPLALVDLKASRQRAIEVFAQAM